MKRSLKKVSILFMSLMVILASVVVPVSAATFSDTQDHWAEAAVDKMDDYNVVGGYEGKFRPNDAVTRAEFATMIDNIMQYVEVGENKFSDLKSTEWYYDAIVKLNTAGVLNGSNGKASPSLKITRQEAAVLVAKSFHIGDSAATATFTDEASIASWAKAAVNALSTKKIINGLPDGTYGPLNDLTRAQAVTIFNNLIQELISKPGKYSNDVQGNLVVNAKDVVLEDMKIAGDLYITEGVGEGEVTLNNVEIAGAVIVRGGGENSIIFNNVDVKGALVVNKYNGKIRILATGSTSVSVTKLESGALIVTKELTGGGFETIEISAEVAAGQEIEFDGNFNKIINQSSTAQITVNGNVKELVANVNTTILGNAVITKISAADGVTATVNDKPAAGGGATSGNGGGDSGSVTTAVTGVSINERNVSLIVNETKQLTAAIAPSNATNKQVAWKIEDGSTDVVTVDQNGLLTAIKSGTKVVKVTTEDGAKTAQVLVTVNQSSIKATLSKFEGDAIDSAADLEDALKTNSSNLSLNATVDAFDAVNHFETLIVAEDAMLATSEEEGSAAYVVVSLNDQNGKPIANASEIEVSVTNSTYTYTPDFGVELSEAYAGSFILPIDAGNPEAIQHYKVQFTSEDYAASTLNVVYVSQGTAYIKGLEAVTGEKTIGSELTAGEILYEGAPANNDVTYKWLRATNENGPYSIIDGATASSYELVEADGGNYIRVKAISDQTVVAGSATSASFGPIQLAVEAEEVFAAIEAAYLSENANQNNVIGNLNLMTALDVYPGVTITWSSDNTAAVTHEGVVTRGEQDDQFANLTATLSGAVKASKVYELTIRAKGTDNVDIVGFIDPYFVEGYPQAYVKDKKIWIKYKVKASAEIFMVVNSSNGHFESSVKAVLEGHAGGDNEIVWVNDWPYFKLDATESAKVQEFNTGVSLGDRSTRIEFVIKDNSDNYTSRAVTTILFDQTVVEALDTEPPYAYDMFINDDLNAIYVYYNEFIDLSSKPKAADYVLNYGSVTSVDLYNYADNWGVTSSYVKLGISGVLDENKSGLKLSYLGSAIQDITDAKNQATTFTERNVTHIEEKIERATISADRKSMIIKVVPGFNPKDNNENNSSNESRFTITVAGKGEFTPSSVNYSYSIGYLSYRLNFATPIPVGDTSLKVSTEGIINWAMDAYPSELSPEEIIANVEPGVPSASYINGKVVLTFADGFELNNWGFNAAGLVLKVDGVEYALRGYILEKDSLANTLKVNLNDKYSWLFKNAVDAGASIEIKYVKVNGADLDQLSDSSGALIPDFGYVTVVKGNLPV